MLAISYLFVLFYYPGEVPGYFYYLHLHCNLNFYFQPVPAQASQIQGTYYYYMSSCFSLDR